jgi:hypothetical protein
MAMIYELRVDEIVPGKAPQAHERLEKHLMGFFAKHGITVVGIWIDEIGTSNQLKALLAFDDLADRERKWSELQSDQAWIEIRTKSEKDGPLLARVTNTILRPTSYSPAQ